MPNSNPNSAADVAKRGGDGAATDQQHRCRTSSDELAHFTPNDHAFMKEALRAARAGLEADEVPVGAVLVRNSDQQIELVAYNLTNAEHNATRHCELVLFDLLVAKLPEKSSMKGYTVYVTVEPCIMCAGALRKLQVDSVVFGCANDRFGGCCSVVDLASRDALGDGLPGFSWKCGLYEEQAIDLLRELYATENPTAPPAKRRRKASMAPSSSRSAALTSGSAG